MAWRQMNLYGNPVPDDCRIDLMKDMQHLPGETRHSIQWHVDVTGMREWKTYMAKGLGRKRRMIAHGKTCEIAAAA